MLPYLTVHNNGMTTTFRQTPTLADARKHLVGLLETGVAKTNDILSIVEMAEDRVIYYNGTNNSPEGICRTAGRPSRSSFWKILTSSVHSVINQVQYAIR